MKRFKKGFTLAEVLITLSIIGVIAAIVMPTMMTNYQYKTLGAKLSKFSSQLESTARAYVVANDTFAPNATASAVADFANDAFLITAVNDDTTKNKVEATGDSAAVTSYTFSKSVPANAKTVSLKDGTKILLHSTTTKLSTLGANNILTVDTNKVGDTAFVVTFVPNAGLPANIQTAYNFVVTELGYVYPENSDVCLQTIYKNGYKTTQTIFTKAASSCIITSGS